MRHTSDVQYRCVYIDIVNIVVQSYGANIVHIYDRDGAWITLK